MAGSGSTTAALSCTGTQQACDKRLLCGGLSAQMQKEIEAGRWRGQDKDGAGGGDADGKGGAAKPVPKPYMSAQYREDAMRTTGRP